MTKWTKSFLPVVLFLIQSFICVSRAQADPITYLQTGGSVFETYFLPLQGGPIVADPTFLGVSFTLDHALQNISISVPQLNFEQEGFTGTAWLTNALGTGTTAANVLATNQIAAPPNPNPDFASYTFFTGLNLDAGTYNFFISSPDCDAIRPCNGFPHGYGVAIWLGYFPGEVQSVEGVHYNNEILTIRRAPECNGGQFDPANGCNINYNFAPASTWLFSPNTKMSFAITQTVAEPSSLALCSICLPLLWIFRRRRLAS